MNLMQRRLAKGDTDVGRYIEAATDGATRASALTQRLLAFSRQQPLDPASLDINQLVASMSELLGRTLGEHIQIDTKLASVWTTFADPVQLESALLNLAVNARDAMTGGGRLKIETANVSIAAGESDAAPGDYVVLAMSDTGVGMSDEVMKRAFDPFFTTKAVGKGTGLGLSQVFGFVRQSGGHVTLESQVGGGSTVKIFLPRSHGKAAANEKRVPGAAAVANPGESVLVVEDDDRVRNNSAEALRELGYEVHMAANGALALEMIGAGLRVDLLFTDIIMPEMNGRRLAQEAVMHLPTLKVLFTTGYARDAVVLEETRGAIGAPLQKPFTLDQLAAKVRAVIDG
jgi:CheY-like chemotaxis protein